MNKQFLYSILALVAGILPHAVAQTLLPERPEIQISTRLFECDEQTAVKLGLACTPDELSPRVGSVLPPAALQELFARLDKEKGVDLVSAPSVTTKSGQRAVIQITREFRYANAFSVEDPGVPNAHPILTPTEFALENTGIILEVEPTLTDALVIDLALIPQVNEFKGFNTLANGKTAALEAENRVPTNGVQLPVFSRLSTATGVQLRNNYSLLLGGFSHIQEQRVQDSGPPKSWKDQLFGKPDLVKTSKVQYLRKMVFMTITASAVKKDGTPITGDVAFPEEKFPVEIAADYILLDREDLPKGLNLPDPAEPQVYTWNEAMDWQDTEALLKTLKSKGSARAIVSSVPRLLQPGETFPFLTFESPTNPLLQSSVEDGGLRLQPGGAGEMRLQARITPNSGREGKLTLALNTKVRRGDRESQESIAAVHSATGKVVSFINAGDTGMGPVGILFVRATLKPKGEIPTAPVEQLGEPPFATVAPAKPGFVISPFAPDNGYIDVRGFPSGTEVKCPYTAKVFRIP